MNLARMRSDLSDIEIDFPHAALRWARENPDVSAPALLAMLTACAKPGDLSDREASGAFFAVPLLAAAGETRAFAPFCALARNGDRLDEILGDFGAEFLHRLLLGVYGGAADALQEIARDATVDPIVRASFLRAWLWHELRHGRERDDDAFETAVSLRTTFVGGDDAVLRVEWAQTLIALGAARAPPLIRDACEKAWIDPSIATFDDLEAEATEWRADPVGQRETFLVENGPIVDLVAVLERWMQRPLDDPASEAQGQPESDEGTGPLVNEFRDVGRNDPCPCGSGRKFKKCCLPKAEAASAP